jgi:hypothetical protein
VNESYCDHCGRAATAPGASSAAAVSSSAAAPAAPPAPTSTAGGHERCRTARAMEPPRYCAACGRRMVVQVTPAGWTARCVRHGTRDSGGA